MMNPESLSGSRRFIKTYQHYINAGIDLAAGSAGGAACVFVGQPLDTLKVKMQTFPHLYRNSFICFRETFIKEGIRGLYAGTVPALVANIAENSVLFCAYGVCQNAVKILVGKENALELNPLENASAGFFAAFFSSFSLCPTELIKCRLQAMRETSSKESINRAHIGPWVLTKEIFKSEGILGFFRGFGVTVLREMPGYFFFFGGYELSRNLLTPKGKSKDEIGLLRTVIAGGIGGVSFWVAIFPADVIKSRLQISKSNDSTVAVTKELIRKEGFKALYKGLGPTVLRTFPASGALFVAYEYTKQFLNCGLTYIP
ncbi:mitochondrial ornithine transporter 1, partial [Trichonephila inaurata madagascariensis]